ncbi:RHS repeat-associated core domain-containing protein [Streptomyces griseoluteus]|uniref:RHS repeat-associated core domain-containing protein n=1 Tax=Streptomyces griseoluteus TaxID=29306 RepID=UPI003810326F
MAARTLARGMGTFFKDCEHPEARWSKCPHEYKIRYRSAAGKQTEKAGFATQDRAITRLTEIYNEKKATLRSQSKAERIQKYGTMRFEEYAEEWKAGQRHLAVASVRHLDSLLEHHLNPALGSRRMNSFDHKVVDHFIRTMERLKTGLATQANAFDKLRAILLDAHRLGIYADNPLLGVKPPQYDPARAVIPSLEQLRGIRTAGDDAFRLMVDLMSGCGLRNGEAAAVNLSNLVADDVYRVSEQVILSTKSYGPLKHRKVGEYRDVPLPARVWETIEWHAEKHGTFESGSKDTYNASGNLTAVTDRNGDKITVAQTLASGTVTGFKATDTRSGRWLSLTRGADAQHVSATDNSGRTVAYVTSGAIASATAKMTVTDVTGGSTVYAYDTSGRVNQVTTPEGRVTKFGYDGQNRITSLQRVAPTGTDTWTYAYSATTRATAGTTKVTDPNAHTTTYTVDDSGQVTKVVDALTHTRSTSYDANHNQLTAVNAQGTGSQNTTTFGWDASDNLTSAKLPTGATTALGAYSTHSGANLPSSLTTPSGKKTSYSYDTSGNLMSSQDTTAGVSNGAKLSYGYQGDDGVADCGGFDGQRCTATDANGNKTSYSYDGQGNLSKTTPPSPLGATTYTYDALGRPATVLDGRGVTTTYTYDNHDRVTKVATSGGSGNLTVGYTYDRDGNLLTQTDASGTLTYTYDGLGREATRTLADGAVYTQGYDPAGNLKTLTDPNGTTTYGYDAADHLTSLKDPTGASTTFTYDEDGNRTATKLPGGTTQSAQWDNADRPTQIKATTPTATLFTYNYSYKLSDGTDTDQIQTRTDPGADKTISYTYDSQSRLSYAQENAGSTKNASWLYCYDKGGNITATSGSASSCSASSGLTSYTYNAANQLTGMNGDTTGWSYDKNGNELSAAGQLPRTGETYNDFNQLTALTTDGSTSRYTYAGTDSSNRLTAGSTRIDQGPAGISTTTAAGKSTGFVRDPAGTLIGMTSGGNPYYYVTDNQGAPSALVDNSGAKQGRWDYSPTGNARPGNTATVDQPFGYTGAYLDSSGLYKMGARYNDPTVGRFSQPDPSGKESNAYLYATADPVNRMDPTGLSAIGDFMGDVANGAGAGAGIGTSIGAGLGLLGGPFAPITVAGGAGTGAIVGTVAGTAVGIGVGIYDL